MSYVDQLQSALTYQGVPPATSMMNGPRYENLGQIPVNLRGLFVLLGDQRQQIEKIRDTIRRQEFGIALDSDEEVRDDHDYVEWIVSQTLDGPQYQHLLAEMCNTIEILLRGLHDVWPGEDFSFFVEYWWCYIDEGWNLHIPRARPDSDFA